MNTLGPQPKEYGTLDSNAFDGILEWLCQPRLYKQLPAVVEVGAQVSQLVDNDIRKIIIFFFFSATGVFGAPRFR